MSLNGKVVELAMSEVQRAFFLPQGLRHRAELDSALPIGYGQTAPRCSVVAAMCDILEVEPRSVVLEIGTGSGYTAAVLSRIARTVHSVERIRALSDSARERLESLRYTNVILHVGDGNQGWLDAAPYDRILVTACAPEWPTRLAEQLHPGGRMLLPIACPTGANLLVLAKKNLDGSMRKRVVRRDFRFVLLQKKIWGKTANHAEDET